MTNPKLIEMICLIDNSGSMQSVKSDAIGNFNRFLSEQQELKTDVDAKFTMVLFNTNYEIRYDGIPIKDVIPLNDKTYQTNGNTALYDAIGNAINTVGNRLMNTPEDDRPSKVIMTILTDGEENSSKEYTSSQIKSMIQHQEQNYQWEFVYLSASVNAFSDSASIGIKSVNTMYYDISKGTSDAYRGINETLTSFRI